MNVREYIRELEEADAKYGIDKGGKKEEELQKKWKGKRRRRRRREGEETRAIRYAVLRPQGMQLMISLGSSLLRLFSWLAIRRRNVLIGAWAVICRQMVEWKNISMKTILTHNNNKRDGKGIIKNFVISNRRIRARSWSKNGGRID